MKIFKKIMDLIGDFLAVAVIGCVIAFCISIAVGIKPYVVLSGSMEPNIHTGSICFVNTKADYDQIKENDIIAFQSGDTLVTHRVINVTKVGLETKGDNNDVSDGVSTTRENFKGETLFSIPYIGYVAQFLKTTRGMIITATVIASFFIIGLLLKGDKDKDEDEKEKDIKDSDESKDIPEDNLQHEGSEIKEIPTEKED